MKKLNKKQSNISRLTAFLLLAAIVNLSAAVFHKSEENYGSAGNNVSVYDSESPLSTIPISSRVEKRSGIYSAAPVLVLPSAIPVSLNKLKLQTKSFHPQNFCSVRERCFLTAEYSTGT